MHTEPNIRQKNKKKNKIEINKYIYVYDGGGEGYIR